MKSTKRPSKLAKQQPELKKIQLQRQPNPKLGDKPTVQQSAQYQQVSNPDKLPPQQQDEPNYLRVLALFSRNTLRIYG